MALILLYTILYNTILSNGFTRKQNKKVLHNIYYNIFILYNHLPSTIIPIHAFFYISSIFEYILQSGKESELKIICQYISSNLELINWSQFFYSKVPKNRGLHYRFRESLWPSFHIKHPSPLLLVFQS